ncbi:FecR/PupR family sigma factor regulator [Arhodomonas sp. AD133]|uniref:FecR/PupR family sigma factor regulator n=1 Tax=Arhodomonas sp. AD133 TaxID=3415009 RepID=UPI003EBF0D73
MSHSTGDEDPLWREALDWVMREHEDALDERELARLRAWLAESPAHREAHEQARRLWLITGLVPPSDDGR